MIKHRLVCACALVFALSCGGDSTAPVVELANEVVTVQAGSAVVSSQIYIRVGIGPFDSEANWLFDQMFIRDGDEGSTLVANAQTEPDFAAFVTALTNGTPDAVARYVGLTVNPIGGTQFFTEAAAFPAKVPAGPDFQGYEIESIRFQIDAVLIATPGQNPNGDGNWTDFQLQGRLIVRGRPR